MATMSGNARCALLSRLASGMAITAALVAGCGGGGGGGGGGGSGSRPSAPPSIDASGVWTGSLHSEPTGEDDLLILPVAQQTNGDVQATLTVWSAGHPSTTRVMDGWVSGYDLSAAARLEPGARLEFDGVLQADSTASGSYDYEVPGDGVTFVDHGTWSAHRLPGVHLSPRQLFTLDYEAGAMTSDGTHIWAAGFKDGEAKLCSYSTAGQEEFCATPPADELDSNARCARGSMAVAGDYIACLGGGGLWFVRRSDGTFDTSRTIYGWNTPCAALTVDDSGKFWCATTQALTMLEPTGEVTSSVPLALPSPAAAAWDGSSFWIADDPTEKIFSVDANGNLLGAADGPPISHAAAPSDVDQRLIALARHGDHLVAAIASWWVETGAPTVSGATTVYELTLQP